MINGTNMMQVKLFQTNKLRAIITDYNFFHLDAETLKIDLDEERDREMIELKNKRNLQKSKLIEEVTVKTELTKVEKEIFANRHREKGNDYFRNKEFTEALAEYSKSITILPTIAGFNNRAMTCKFFFSKYLLKLFYKIELNTDIKLHKNSKAINDCNECLKLDPCNIKALLRKAQALCSNNKNRDALNVYRTVVGLDGCNTIALNKIQELEREIKFIPPENAFRFI